MNTTFKPKYEYEPQLRVGGARRAGALGRAADRAVDFVDERFADAAGVLAGCRGAAERLWRSRWYMPVCFVVQAAFIAAGYPVAGGMLTMSLLIFMLLFCADLMSVLFPLLLLTLLGTEFYSGLYDLLQYWWFGVLAAAALLIHIGAYADAPRDGGCMHSLVAVSVATLTGGLGVISREEYFSGTALYYSLGLGVVMLLIYLLARTEAVRERDYDATERLMRILAAAGLFTGFVVLLFYARHWAEFSQNFATIRFEYRNFCATMMLMALPAAAYLAVREKRWLGALAFLYLALLLTGSRSGLLFGTILLALCAVYLYRYDVARRRLMRRAALICAVPLTLALTALVHTLFASRVVDGALIGTYESRVVFFLQAFKDFASNPLFGIGLGSMQNAQVFLGVEGSIVWYHNSLAQIIGSMGLVGLAAYGWMFLTRVRLLWSRRGEKALALALVYLAMLLISLTNPGEFCPLPNALLMVVLFVVAEQLPARNTAAAAQGKERF